MVATDLQGNTDDTPAEYSFTIHDITQPTFSITAPVDGSKTKAKKLTAITGTAADGESGVTEVQVAIQQVMKSGICNWFNGTAFVPGDCGVAPFTVPADGTTSWTFAIPKLKKSVGRSKVLNYSITGFSRDAGTNISTYPPPPVEFDVK